MNTLEIQRYDEQIAALTVKIQRLQAQDSARAQPGFYICSRCGLLYQSQWGCGCPSSSAGAQTK